MAEGGEPGREPSSWAVVCGSGPCIWKVACNSGLGAAVCFRAMKVG